MTGQAIRGDVPFQIAEVENSNFLLSKFMNIIRNKYHNVSIVCCVKNIAGPCL